ncbi:hypothetical protein B0J12DRAFT_768668 [Macrophomina phaseolina]|uniref:UDP-glucuronosyl/UDP-glucosyltransferase n=1 Tax=Macrophomina phaseolina TaxID=35725 RepID=A0ABQ8FYA7_9PEZI|nr:hypothetical protein B0J12DRAFT_768668 [Macrophomina phaseolina]
MTLMLLFVIRVSHILRPRTRKPSPSARTVLLTTSPSTQHYTLALACGLHAAGHTVVVASSSNSSSPFWRFLPTVYSFSPAVSRHHRLSFSSPSSDIDASALYEHNILGAILRFRPRVWVPCELFGSSPDATVRETVAQLRDDLRREDGRGGARVKCSVLAPEETLVRIVSDRDAFAEFVSGLGSGVEVVGAGVVVVRRRGRSGRKVELPVKSLDETYEAVSRLDISPERPWTMREAVDGEQYTAHAVVVRGALRAFAVSRTDADGAAGRRFLALRTPLHTSVLSFTEAFVAALPEHTSFPLAFDFIVHSKPTATGTTSRIYPSRCSWVPPRIPIPPFSTALAELVDSTCQPSFSTSATASTSSPAVDTHETALPSAVHTPPNSPALKPTNRFVASSSAGGGLPTPPSSPSSRSRCSGSPRPPSSRRGGVPQDADNTNSAANNAADRNNSSGHSHVSELTGPNRPRTSPNALLPASVAGIYALGQTVLVYVLLPLLELLSKPSRRGVVEVAQGWAVLVERVLLPGAWVEEELEGWGDMGTWVWQRGVVGLGKGRI